MSIINEALKKAGQPIITERSEFRKKKTRMNWGPVFVMGVLALITTPLLAPLFNAPYKTAQAGKKSPAFTMPETSSGRVSGQFAVEEAPLAAGPSMPNFSLSGLVYSKTDSYCLINGKVMRIGDQIGGATLSEVTPREVVLNYRGEKVVLPASAA